MINFNFFLIYLIQNEFLYLSETSQVWQLYSKYKSSIAEILF